MLLYIDEQSTKDSKRYIFKLDSRVGILKNSVIGVHLSNTNPPPVIGNSSYGTETCVAEAPADIQTITCTNSIDYIAVHADANISKCYDNSIMCLFII